MRPSVQASFDPPPLAQGGSSPRLASSVDLGGRQGAAAWLSASLPTAGGAAALAAAFRSSAAADLEQPLLPGEDEAEQQYVEHVLEPKPWPTLRGSSVSTRRSELCAAPHVMNCKPCLHPQNATALSPARFEFCATCCAAWTC